MKGRGVWILMVVIGMTYISALVPACSPSGPEDKRIEETLRDYFGNRGYRVMQLQIEAVERNPLPERDYMGPLTFVVKISSLTLEATEAAGSAAMHRAEPISFTNATVHLRRGSLPEREWEVARITGIDIL